MTTATPSQRGFTLLEVMIALTLFALFASAFLVSQGYNVSDSALSEEQLKLRMLCEQKMNEVLIKPPPFSNAMQDLKETKTFEEKEYQGYTWTVEWKRLKVPDFAKLFAAGMQGKDGENTGEDANKYYDDANSGQRNQNQGLEKMVFEKLKENLERVLWQVRFTVTNKETKYSYSLSRWMTNHAEPVQLNLNF